MQLNKKLGNLQDSLDPDRYLVDNLHQNNYIDNQISRTAMSHVYKTMNKKIFKFVPQSSPEIKIATQQLFTKDQNIVDIVGLEQQQNGYFMEQAKEDLENYCFRNNQNIHNLVAIFIQMALGVQQFHNQKYDAEGFKQNVDGWTHRDIKISNFLVFEEKDPIASKRTVVKLCDFGISTDRINNITDQGQGTLSYMSPEHFENSPMTQKIDIWALGVAYTQLLTNVPLFFVSNDLPIAEQFIKYGQLIRNFKQEDLPYKNNQQIRELLLDMLGKDPSQRPTTQIIIQRLLKIQMQMFHNRINRDFSLNFIICYQEFQIRFVKYVEESMFLCNNEQLGVEFLVNVINEDVVSNKRHQDFIYVTYCRHPNYIGLKFEIGYNKNQIESPINLIQNYSFQNCYDIIQLIISQFDESPTPFIINNSNALKKYLLKYFYKELVEIILEKEANPGQNYVLTLFYLSLTKDKELQNIIRQVGKQMGEQIGSQIDKIGGQMGEQISKQMFKLIAEQKDQLKLNQYDKQIKINWGEQIGQEIGKQMGRQIGEQIGKEMGEQIDKKLDIQKGQQICQQMGEEIGKQIGEQIGKLRGELMDKNLDIQRNQQRGEEMGQQIGKQMGSQIGKQISEEIGTQWDQQIDEQIDRQFIKQISKQHNLKNMMMRDQIAIIKKIAQVETEICELAQFIQFYYKIEQRVKFIYKLYQMIKNTQTKFQYIYLYFQHPFHKTMTDVNKVKGKKVIDNLIVSIDQPEFRKLIKNNKLLPSYTEFMQFTYFTDKTQEWDLYLGYSQIIKDIFSDSDLYQQQQIRLIFSLLNKLHQPILQKDPYQIEVIFSSLLNSPDQIKVYHELTDVFSSISIK